VNSLNAQAALSQSLRAQATAMQQLSSGKRINSASDDAAGLAITMKMQANISGMNQAVRNANDSISMLQTADAGAGATTTMLQRMRELAVQAANGTYSSTDRSNLNTEFGNLQNEIDRVAKVTLWNGVTLGVGKSLQMQVGYGSAATTNVVTVSTSTLTTTALSVSSAAITSQSNALGAISAIDAALTTLATDRAGLGAKINRFQFTVDGLTNTSTNTSASVSRIQDTDYSQATASLSKAQI
jgi:flagellin